MPDHDHPHTLGSLGKRLAQYRQRQGLSQEALAAALGVGERTIRRWEKDQALPQPALRQRLAQLLGIDFSFVLDEMTHSSPQKTLPSSPPWFLPLPRNPFFTGRDELVTSLHDLLTQQRTAFVTQSYALSGLGGVGKTQLVLEYAYRHVADYTALFWINAETSEAITNSLLQIAETLQLPERQKADQQRVVVAVQQWLSNHDGWLLIWDNLEDLELFHRFLPLVAQGAHLLTTRQQAVGTLGSSIPLESMEVEEGATLLLRRAKLIASDGWLPQASEQVQADAKKLSLLLGGLPLALDQAGAFIEEAGCDLSEYLHFYQAHRHSLLARRGTQTNAYPASVATTWTLSFQRVEQAHPAAAELLRLCALLAPDHIPEELLLEGATFWPARLQQALQDRFSFYQLLRELLRFSLVKRQSETRFLSLHRLVQVIQVEAMELEEQREWSQRVILAVNALFPREPQADIASWPQCLRYLEQVQACFTLIQRYQHLFPEAADLLERAGTYLLERGLYEHAEPLFQQALAIRERSLEPEHSLLASPLNNLAVVYKEQGKYAEAEPLYQRALTIREQSLGPEHPLVANVLNNLAVLYRRLGRFEEAERLQVRELSITERTLGPDHPLVAGSLNNLAILYKNQARYEEAEPLYVRALHIWEQNLGPEHLQVALLLCNMATLYSQQGKGAEAEPLYLRALATQKQHLEPGHPLLVYPITGLANLYYQQGRYSEAEPLFQSALSTRQQALGWEHPETANTMYDFARLREAQGYFEEAEEWYARALAVYEQQLGPDHPDTAKSLVALGELMARLDNLEQAESFLQRAYAILEMRLGSEHSATLEAGRTYQHVLAQKSSFR